MNNKPVPLLSELDIFATDLNGQLRGKRMPLSYLRTMFKHGFKMPRSVLAVDYWGDDVQANGLVFETGDSDGLCFPVTEKPITIPWLDGDNQQIMSMMFNPDGSPFLVDPRQVLIAVVERYKALGLTPVVATELEFYLLDGENPLEAASEALFDQPDVYAMDRLDNERDLLADIRQACAIQGIPIDSCTAEFGNGQFECNLNHVPDPVIAADHGILFKRLVKGVAKKHGKSATFMPKPFMEKSGNGFHLHFSLLDEQGNNIFDNGDENGSETLLHAVGGLIHTMSDAMLIFAPNLNSYRRFIPGSHAPAIANWGYENRSVAVRIPDSPNVARRIEHRVSGADANPYLVIATILATALYGIQNKIQPPEPMEGNAYDDEEGLQLPNEWHDAILQFQESSVMKSVLGEQLVQTFSAIKEQEHHKFAHYISPVEYDLYL